MWAWNFCGCLVFNPSNTHEYAFSTLNATTMRYSFARHIYPLTHIPDMCSLMNEDAAVSGPVTSGVIV